MDTELGASEPSQLSFVVDGTPIAQGCMASVMIVPVIDEAGERSRRARGFAMAKPGRLAYVDAKKSALSKKSRV